MNDWNGCIDELVIREVRKRVAAKRAEMMADWDAPATYDDPLGGMSSKELASIQELLATYEIIERRRVEEYAYKQWLTHLIEVITFE